MSATARGMRSTGCDDKADLNFFAEVQLFWYRDPSSVYVTTAESYVTTRLEAAPSAPMIDACRRPFPRPLLCPTRSPTTASCAS